MKKVKIIGVPEHFNLPWQLCIENGEFQERGIDVSWTDIPEGTGKMCELLRNKETDLAVILTEGIIKDIAKGNPSTLIQEYVSSPLVWGIHVAQDSPIQSLEELANKRIAISRYGSGSHLMAIVHAKKMNWNTEELNFVVVNTLEGAIEALQNNEADYFMWEKFMTQPIVDQQIFRRIGEFPTPWPSFVIAGTNEFCSANEALIDNLLEVINTTTSEFKIIPSIDRTLATKYHQKLEDIQTWLSQTQWSQRQLKQKHFDAVVNELTALKQIDSMPTYKKTVR